jgi:TPR repeat protein
MALAALLLLAACAHGAAPRELLPRPAVASAVVLERVRREARQGSATSRYMLGLYQYYGAAGVPQDPAAALQSFRTAAEASYGPAALAVGMLLEASSEAAGAAPAALPWYQRAGDWGEAEGHFRAGMLLYEGRASAAGGGGGGGDSDSPSAGVRGGREQDMALALRLLQRSAAAGHAPALDALGLMHEYGVHSGGVQDVAEAARLYHMGCHWAPAAASSGSASALQASLSRGGSSDSDSGSGGSGAGVGDSPDAEACYHLALLHAYGRGLPQNFPHALQLLQRANSISGAVHAPSALLLGRLLANGQGAPTDYQAALAHLAGARDSGDARVAGEAGQLYAALDAQVMEAEAGMAEALADIQAGLRAQPAEG